MRHATTPAVLASLALVTGLLVASASASTAAPGPGEGDGDALAAGLIVSAPGSGAAVRDVPFDEPATAQDAERAADELAVRLDDATVVPDYVRRAADASPVAVDDPLFPQQTSIWDTSRPAGGYSTRAPAFWQRTAGIPTVRVAVLDTGSRPHPDLVWSAGRDIVDRDDDPTDPGSKPLPSSGDFHGTHVAGTVAARANNGIGVVGVAPAVSLVPVRGLDGEGDGFDSDVIRGIYWAAGFTVDGSTNPAPVQVISMSLAGKAPCTAPLAAAVDAARARGIVVVAAAGNDGADAAAYAPGSCPGVISVGATDATGARASFSNTGASVDISAPGVGVLSTSQQGSTPGYRYMSGTSMAAPAVSGAAALLASTGLTGAQIETNLPQMVTPSTTPGTPGVLNLTPPPAAPAVASTVSVKIAKTKLRKGDRAVLRVRLRSASGARPAGTIRVFDGSRIVRTATVSVRRKGTITVKTPRLKRKGVHRLRVVYLGGSGFTTGRSVTRTVRVR